MSQRSGRLSRRSLLLLALAAVLAVAFVRLGMWQLDRLEERRAFNRAVARAEHAEPLPIEDVGAEDEYVRVEAAGEYLSGEEVILYGRSLDDHRGNHVLTPLRTGAITVIVDRGWVPFELDRPPVQEAAPPSGDVRVVGVLYPFERDSDRDAAEASTVMPFVDRGKLEAVVGAGVFPLYLRLQSQQPDQGRALPRTLPPPPQSEGPHLSYAIQWFSFAVIALVGSAFLALRERRGGTRSRPDLRR